MKRHLIIRPEAEVDVMKAVFGTNGVNVASEMR